MVKLKTTVKLLQFSVFIKLLNFGNYLCRFLAFLSNLTRDPHIKHFARRARFTYMVYVCVCTSTVKAFFCLELCEGHTLEGIKLYCCIVGISYNASAKSFVILFHLQKTKFRLQHTRKKNSVIVKSRTTMNELMFIGMGLRRIKTSK